MNSETKALVSDEDFIFLQLLTSWKLREDGYVYALSGYNTTLHRIVASRMGLNPDIVDHEDRVRHTCQRDNLRPATAFENTIHAGLQSGRKYKGVKQLKANLFEARIIVSGKYKYLGRFSNEETAARAYNVAALRYHGNRAVLNEVPN